MLQHNVMPATDLAKPLCDAERHKEDAERPELHADAEHRHDSQLDVCMTLASRGESMPGEQNLLLLLAEGRGSELVHESASAFSESVSFELPYLRTMRTAAPVAHPPAEARIVGVFRLIYNAGGRRQIKAQ
ncbi:hypothetical protein ALO95_102222 [Pseudomonas syringae pv. antirrhini]|uniref:Uncharacterized protein n=5 Tax=Pseudomonas syringae group TaxID=136849 RepID=A0A0N8QNC8_9PSED|nr:hypothetical protein ALO87_102433 [Pseudomonas syringae pv. apii]KPW47230.1 hypothetical protein ALO88_102624 [Pseudomonas syringae pv. antirrhini]KPX71164.1 hypothetical protein ALO84_102190 [Pseudomonas syringae pv. maculicola]KPY15429.1 hypothetical protein ALO54_102407 [Pseudomonas syringae pv. philadelphi]KWT05123.1 hypothetical protein AL046_25700 [Pseudomonas syringae pv. avii]PHN59628.1 hypothetical protein AO286_00755 [Pseudomonas syringae]RMO93345.1 hypothetical protein ALQ32_102